MPRKKKHDDLELAAGTAESEPYEAKDPTRGKGPEYKALTTKLAEQRLIRLRQQNSKLRLDLKKTKGEVGDIEQLKRSVLAANHTVKQQLLALPSRIAPRLVGLSDQREIIRLLTAALTEALNDLAYETKSK